MDQKEPGTIIFLHGTSSSGKTSIAEALQEIEPEPWMHLSLDHFFEMQPKRYRTIEWPLYSALSHGLHRSAVTWANLGLSVIVDTVLEREDLLWDAVNVLKACRAYFVAVRCPLDELERREIARGDRPIGLARFQFNRVHRLYPYDLELTSFGFSPHENAALIVEYFRSSPSPRGFRNMFSHGAMD